MKSTIKKVFDLVDYSIQWGVGGLRWEGSEVGTIYTSSW